MVEIMKNGKNMQLVQDIANLKRQVILLKDSIETVQDNSIKEQKASQLINLKAKLYQKQALYRNTLLSKAIIQDLTIVLDKIAQFNLSLQGGLTDVTALTDLSGLKNSKNKEEDNTCRQQHLIIIKNTLLQLYTGIKNAMVIELLEDAFLKKVTGLLEVAITALSAQESIAMDNLLDSLKAEKVILVRKLSALANLQANQPSNTYSFDSIL